MADVVFIRNPYCTENAPNQDKFGKVICDVVERLEADNFDVSRAEFWNDWGYCDSNIFINNAKIGDVKKSIGKAVKKITDRFLVCVNKDKTDEKSLCVLIGERRGSFAS